MSIIDDATAGPRTDPASQPTPQRAPRGERKQLDSVGHVGRFAAVLASVITLIPLPVVILVALSESWVQGPLAGLTMEWLTAAWTRMGDAVLVSLRIAVIVLIIDMAVALPASWLVARYRFPGRSLIRSLSTLPIAVPGIAIGLGLILTFPELRPTGWLLVGGHILYTMPFLFGTLLPAMSDPRLQEKETVASSLGVGPLRRFFTVTAPGVRTALLAGTLMVLTLSLGEFNVSFFLFTPTEQPMPVSLFDSYLTGRIESAAAQTVLFLALVIPPAIAMEKLGGAKAGQA